MGPSSHVGLRVGLGQSGPLTGLAAPLPCPRTPKAKASREKAQATRPETMLPSSGQCWEVWLTTHQPHPVCSWATQAWDSLDWCSGRLRRATGHPTQEPLLLPHDQMAVAGEEGCPSCFSIQSPPSHLCLLGCVY